MTTQEGADARAARSTATPPPGPLTGPSQSTEWVRFGGILMAIIGPFSVIEGLLALAAPDTFVTVQGRVLAIDLTGWAWVHIVFGVLVFVVGMGLLRSEVSDTARIAGIVVVTLSMIVQLAWLPAAPIWSIIMIVFCLLVLQALVVTSGDFRVGR
ncbi:DUF7144 family membrane protein [Actinomycetospora cinnamomea]|uniref:DUF7144 domain-containing protein n=1 Tax=Actinomycetospora cinnamomea TaxID=663609 RepID=A0A2U1EDF3_9PSEU|nr:hypothetical protein [Actinomycetospora cinnamomea]PVY97988.1 hypothetical protein C8D89_12243 [Actinomycetospora cinnamomea]